MNRIGIIGDADSVLGFKAFGLDAYACLNKDEAAETLHKIVKDDYGIIFITERYYMEIEDEIAKYAELRIPAIVAIPGSDGGYGIGLSNVKRAVEKAVGADILFGDK
ncbi:MAG: V-type ATP synthase subunit F [Clostridiales bacterium]|nr:V-type ATP synthase subunit F [Candidatus Crickella caballi]